MQKNAYQLLRNSIIAEYLLNKLPHHHHHRDCPVLKNVTDKCDCGAAEAGRKMEDVKKILQDTQYLLSFDE